MSTNPRTLVSVVVLNWNGKRFLKPCLDSLLAQTVQDREIILIDNGSTDGSVEFVKSCYADHIKLIENRHNDGFAKGTNIGMMAATGEFIAILNNDAVATPQWLEELLKGMWCGRDVGMCAPKTLFYDNRQVIDNVGHLLYPDGLNAGRGRGEVDQGQYDQMEEILFPDGSAALYRRAMLDEIGLFDEQFFSFVEDAELGLRGRLFGWRCMYVPTAVVYHVRGGTVGRWSPTKAMLVERNRFWVAVKLFPPPLLFLSPLFTLIRFSLHSYSAFVGKGSAGRFVAEHSKTALLSTLVRAYGSALRGLPMIMRKRWEIRRKKTMSDQDFIRLVLRFRISARELALRNR